MSDSDSDRGGSPLKRHRIDGGGFADGGLDEPSAEVMLESMLSGQMPIAAAPPQGPPPPATGLWLAEKGKGKGKNSGEPRQQGRPPDLLVQDAKIPTTQMEFSKPVNLPTSEVVVPKRLVEALMTPESRLALIEQSGSNIEWCPEEAKVVVQGSPEQMKRAQRLLARAMMHCQWGHSKDKIQRLLKPPMAESVLCRLSPMNALQPAEKLLKPSHPIMSIGKDKTNTVRVPDPIISRTHAALELDAKRGAVYVIDCSTNGTFLNGRRLPSKKDGKVLLSHGDELLLKDPAGGDKEFGYIVNLSEIQMQVQVKLEAPRRLLSPAEMSSRPGLDE